MKKLVLLLFLIPLIGISQKSFELSKYKKSDQSKSNILKFDVPKSQYDSLNINLQYTKYCLNKYRSSFLKGYSMQIIGAVGASAGAYFDKKEAVIAGGVISFVGLFISFNSFKWLRKASVSPKIEPDGMGVIINL